MNRRTKIVCTLGPATSSREKIEELVRAGMDVARLNLSHGSHEDHRQVYELIRQCEQIAAASGGLFGIGKVSSAERATLEQIARGLKR